MRWSLRTDRVKIGRLFAASYAAIETTVNAEIAIGYFAIVSNGKRPVGVGSGDAKGLAKKAKKKRERLRRRESRWKLQRLEQRRTGLRLRN